MPLIQEAGGTLLAWSTQDGGPALAHGLLQRCWDLPGHPIGPDNSTVIEDGGAVVALLLGGEAGAWTRDESAHLVPLEGLARLPILQRFHRRLQTQRDARPALPAGAWYLSSLGVRPSHRRRGLHPRPRHRRPRRLLRPLPRLPRRPRCHLSTGQSTGREKAPLPMEA